MKNPQGWICPECGKNENKIIDKEEILPVRGEEIKTLSKVRVCACGYEFFDEQLEEENLTKAYDIYRKKYNILTPDQIRTIRETYGLSQRTLGKILGWGEITVHRYETGALPDASHNLMLKALRNPETASELLCESKDQIPKSTFSRAMVKVQALLQEKQCKTFKDSILEIFKHKSLNLESGFKQFDFNKFANAVLYFAENIDQLWKTELNKLMFFLDFQCFKEYTVSLTGVKYKKYEHGPVPDNYDTLLWFMEQEGLISLTPHVSGDYKGHIICPLTEADPDIFEDYEWNLLQETATKYRHFHSNEISEISHKEKGWIETQLYDTISYDYANSISYSYD